MEELMKNFSNLLLAMASTAKKNNQN